MRHMGDGVGYRKTHVRSPSPDGNSKAENIPLNGEEDGDERVAQDEEDMQEEPEEGQETSLGEFMDEDEDLENEMFSYGYDNDGEDSEGEGFGDGEGGPEDGEVDDETDEYCGYAQL